MSEALYFVSLAHRGVEAILGDADALAQDGGLERFRGEVALHLLDVGLPEQLEIFDRAVFLVVHCYAAHLV